MQQALPTFTPTTFFFWTLSPSPDVVVIDFLVSPPLLLSPFFRCCPFLTLLVYPPTFPNVPSSSSSFNSTHPSPLCVKMWCMKKGVDKGFRFEGERFKVRAPGRIVVPRVLKLYNSRGRANCATNSSPSNIYAEHILPQCPISVDDLSTLLTPFYAP